MIVHGGCLEEMARMDAESIAAVVTDPPYGLSFMGKVWDHGVPGIPFWAEMLRVAKPGAHLLAFGGTRTVHRIAAAIEDAGWEIRDMLVWAYASGFPKSLDVSKAIDKAAGATREVTGTRTLYGTAAIGGRGGHATVSAQGGSGSSSGAEKVVGITAPATPDAEKWQGWGTALKPAWEPIVMARKPLRGTVAANVLAHGTGALNIDGTRIEHSGEPVIVRATEQSAEIGMVSPGPRPVGEIASASPLGRWPANVILTDPIFDGGIEGVVGGGEDKSQTATYRNDSPIGGVVGFGRGDARLAGETVGYGDSGTYSRFFLIPKADRAEREPIAGMLPIQSRDGHFGQLHEGTSAAGNVTGRYLPRANVHPTVKPVDLMRHLVRLVTPPGGTVLDPFLGSGTTGIACEMEGFDWIGIEKEAEYVAIAEARLIGVQRGLGLDVA